MASSKKKDDPTKGKKKTTIELIRRKKGGKQDDVYRMADSLAQHHPNIDTKRVIFGLRSGWREDVDGRTKLTDTKVLNELERELTDSEYDFVVLLNREIFETCDEDLALAMIDRGLCACAVKLDKTGGVAVDVKDRRVTRKRKFDVEEHTDVVKRHGPYLERIEQLVEAASNPITLPLKDDNGRSLASSATESKADSKAEPKTNSKADSESTTASA